MYVFVATFTSKAQKTLWGVFLTMINFVPLGHLFCIISYKQKLAKGDKANHGWENTLWIFVPILSKSLWQIVS